MRRLSLKRLTRKNSAEPVRERFWELPLADLTQSEWEQLCDGCARCCLLKIEEDEPAPDGQPVIHFTRVSCRFLNRASARCSVYRRRQKKMPDCVVMDIHNLPTALHWIPSTCAYKLRYQEQPLPSWHPLLTGSTQAMQEAGITVAGRVISEDDVHDDDLEEQIIRWVEA